MLGAHPDTAMKMYLEGSAVVVFTPCAADLLRLLDVSPEDGPKRVVNEGPVRSALLLAQAHPWTAALMAVLELVLLGLYLLAARGALSGLFAPRTALAIAGSFSLLCRCFRRSAGCGALPAADDACRLDLCGSRFGAIIP